MQGTKVQSPAREGPACLAALKAAPGEPVCGSKRVAPTQPACSKEKPAQSKVRIKCSLNNNFMEIKFQRINYMRLKHKTSLGGSDRKASAHNAGDPGSIPGSERSPGEGNGNQLHYSCLENSMEGGD